MRKCGVERDWDNNMDGIEKQMITYRFTEAEITFTAIIEKLISKEDI